jgi:hypothetical protein
VNTFFTFLLSDAVLTFLLSEIVFIPFCVAIFRWKRIDKTYHPFFVLLGLGVLTEVFSFWVIQGLKVSNASIVNVYGLLEYTLIVLQFYRWRGFRMGMTGFYLLQAGSLLLWIVCNLVFFHLRDYDLPLYRIFSSFVIVILSINEINRMIIHENGSLYKNARFIICLGFIIFFLYYILYEGAFLVGKTDKSQVSIDIIHLFNKVNAFVNGLYLVAVILVPRKRNSAFERIFDRIGEER